MTTIDRITAEVLADLRPWDATYDVEAIVADLRDSYPAVADGASIETIPETERWETYRVYDHAVI